MDNQSIIINIAKIANFDQLQVKNLFVNITDYPNFIRGQGGTGVIQYSDEVLTTLANTDVELLLYKTETNYPNTVGYLIRVWYEIGFQIKAANATADVTYKLQAKNKGGSWVDMSVAVTASNVGTSWSTKLIKGYMDIQNGANNLPCEFRLIFQSNESDTDILVSFTCTWGSSAPGGSGSCRAAYQHGDNLYISIQDTIYYQTGNDSWVACTGSMGQVRLFYTSDVNGTSLIYAVTNTTMRKKGAANQVWANIAGSPSGAWSLIHSDFTGTETLYIGCNDGEIKKTTDGAAFSTCGSAGSSPIRALCVWDDKLYAGSENGDVYLWDESTGWTTVHAAGLNTLGITEIYALAVHTINSTEQLYAAGLGTKIAQLATNGSTWSDAGSLAGNASRVFALLSFLQDGEPASVLFAATGNGADVDYWDNSSTWTNTGELSGDYQALCLAVYTENDTIYAGSNNWGKIWKANITATWASGEGIGRIKNDGAGQETLFEIVGRIIE